MRRTRAVETDEIHIQNERGLGLPPVHDARVLQSCVMTAPPIGNLLTEARAAWSLDETDLAARAALDLESVRAALRGEADVSDLADVARALGGSMDDLLAGARFWEAPAVAFKSAAGRFELPLVRASLLRLSAAARDRAALAALLDLPAPAEPIARLEPLPLTEEVTVQAEELAKRVRRALGEGDEPIASIRQAMRRLGVSTFLTDLGSEAVDGLTWRDSEGFACAAANASARGGKLTALRMTFAHELCHALFDGTKLAAFGVVEQRAERAEGLEQRANAFAAHLLAPQDAVLRFLRERGLRAGEKPSAVHVRALSEHFGMGASAVAGHLVSCGVWKKLDMGRHHGLFTRDAIGEDSAELHPSDAEALVPIERRGELLELASMALERGEISVGRWREVLGIRAGGDWRRLLEERQVSCDVEHRSEV